MSLTVSLVAGPLGTKAGTLSYLYALSKALAFGSKGLALEEICPPAKMASFPPPSYYGLAYMFSSSSSSCAPSAMRGPFGFAAAGASG